MITLCLIALSVFVAPSPVTLLPVQRTSASLSVRWRAGRGSVTHLSCPSETQPLSCRPVKVRLMTGADLDQLSALKIRSERGLNCGFLSF